MLFRSTIVLAGIAIHSVAQTILMFLKLAADPEKQLASIEYWIMGSLNGISRNSLAIPFLTTLAGFIIMAMLYRQVLILSTSEEEAVSLGVNVTSLRFIILMLATLVVSSIICVTGLISFIGLIAPHIARLLMQDMARLLGLKPEEVVDVLKIYQTFDPILKREPLPQIGRASCRERV